MNRLPPETISRIARCFLDGDSIDARSIIPLTHVCRFWRESIVSTPRNWTLISSEWIGLAKLSLKRSGAAPLELSLDISQVKRNSGFSALLVPYVRNIESLSINFVSSTNELAQMLRNFPQSTPNLRSLSLFGCPDRGRSADPSGLLTTTLTHLSLTDTPLYPEFLRLRALTDLTLRNHRFDLHRNTLLEFLEENRSLERATLEIKFTHLHLRASWARPAVIMNRLRYLSMRCSNTMDNKALLSGIAIRRGVHLEISCHERDGRLNDVLSGIPAVQLSNLLSSTFMEYQTCSRSIRLLGPNGNFSFENPLGLDDPFVEFPLLPLIDVRELHLRHRKMKEDSQPLNLLVLRPSFFPALKTLAVDCETNVSHLFSALFRDPSFPPSLKTLAFLDCNLADSFMVKLARFASSRSKTDSVRLHRVVIVNSEGKFPSVASIDALGKHVPVINALIGKKLPTDLI